jgi:3-oxoacyl-[acyl-carrier protein] reductase
MVGAGHKAFRDLPAYAACKAMLESYTRSLAKELAGDRITVNCIALGMTELPPDGAPDYKQTAESTWRRIGQADIAALIRYLASEESSGMTGAVIPLGGGFGL